MTGSVITYHGGMGRWAPGAEGRLQEAALALFLEKGFEQTTVADIAARAGLTERTFYRYFTDKREVLFRGGQVLQQLVTDAIGECPAETRPLDAVAAGLHRAAVELFADRGPLSRGRQAIIDAHPELQERELLKLAALATAIAQALRERGVADPVAGLAAESGVAVFRIAFAQWVDPANQHSLADLLTSSFEQLRQVTS